MKTLLLVVLAVIALGTGSALAIMNDACKSSHHAWCAPISDIRHHAKLGAARFASQSQKSDRWIGRDVFLDR
jgi:hypothetical protein